MLAGEWGRATPAQWADESAAIRDTIYPETEILSYDYAYMARPILNQQMSKGGVRLTVALVGVVGGFGAYMAIAAHRHAPPVVVAPFQFTGLIWGASLGWLIWRDVPAPAVWLGAAIIVLSSLYVTHREAVLARQK